MYQSANNTTTVTWPDEETTKAYLDKPKTLAFSWDDATWILTSAFIIFTMQSGFGLLESGAVSGKNEVNIMVKNAVDVVFGGMTYWMFGFGVSFGMDPGTNAFTGIGYFLLDPADDEMGEVFTAFVFQLSFATTATTIVSGAMAERTRLSAYILFSLLNTVMYCFPAHWVWGYNGFLKQLGCVDIAGSGVVHIVGGTAGMVATLMLGSRSGRFDNGIAPPPMGNPANSLIGMFMLWWGWLGFNCGSTFGISGGKWKLAAKSAVTTLNASMAGGATGLLFSYVFNNRKYDVSYLVNSVLGSLVGITASCAVVRPWEAFIIGAVAALFTVLGMIGLNRLGVDDPVGAVATHGCAGLWGMLSVGLFVDIDPLQNITFGRRGLFRGGGGYLLGIQALSALTLASWSAAISFLLLFLIQKTIGLRMDPLAEKLGADFVEHDIGLYDEAMRTSLARSPGTRHALETGRRRYSEHSKVMPSGVNIQENDLNVRVTRQEAARRKSKAEAPQT